MITHPVKCFFKYFPDYTRLLPNYPSRVQGTFPEGSNWNSELSKPNKITTLLCLFYYNLTEDIFIFLAQSTFFSLRPTYPSANLTSILEHLMSIPNLM